MKRTRRTAVLEAVAEAMVDRGGRAATVSVADVARRAGVTHAEVEDLVGDGEACLLAAFELGVQRARACMKPRYDAEARWLDAIRAGLAAFVCFVEDEPALARLCVVSAAGGGPALQLRRIEIARRLARVVDRGRLAAPNARQGPPEVIAEGVVGAVVAVVQNRLLAADTTTRPLRELFGALVSIVALPYLGAAVARRELTRPMPRMREDARSEPAGADARVTYRSARVLAAIADHPGSSNREVAERAGVVDQGQISKLLRRLAARGLIEKIGVQGARGAPNSWQLTPAGRERLPRP